jgi:hypothetical protein
MFLREQGYHPSSAKRIYVRYSATNPFSVKWSEKIVFELELVFYEKKTICIHLFKTMKDDCHI